MIALAILAMALPTVPGAINPAVTQANIGGTICVSGWTATVRPAVAYTNRIKRQRMAEAGIAGSDPRALELDHAVPLAVGGAPRLPTNLQLQWWDGLDGAKLKDRLEALVHRKVCARELTLAQGRAVFINDGWRAGYRKYIGKLP